jgi:hypothetical protein
MATSATEQEAGGGTALQQRPHYLENQKTRRPGKILSMGAVFTSRDILMSNGPEDNGNQVFCKGSLVTRFKATKIVTGNGKFPSQVVTRWASSQMTRTLSANSRWAEFNGCQ